MKMDELKYTHAGLMLAVDSFFYDDFIYFWKHQEHKGKITKACLSQWYPCSFEADGTVYNCAEQYMMVEKARIFGDEATRQEILLASDPAIIKKLGRKVCNFDADIWNEKSIEVVYNGNLQKFSQNQKLKDFLLSTGKSTLVEASPYDRIWGIGKSEEEKDINIPHFWKGENRLGFILMEVRETLLSTVQKEYKKFGYSKT